MLTTPVLFIIFNRPETTREVFEQIRKAKPKQLFLAADGPRKSKPGEEEKCLETRKIVLDGIDWDCELKTLIRDENRGCAHGPAEAITWFFENVAEGIVLEDDVLPSESFFPFCQQLLEKYRNDERIRCITGTNYLSSSFINDFSYRFSEFAGCWGWASWSRAWKGFDYKISNWKDKEIQSFFNRKFNRSQLTFFKQVFDTVHNKAEVDIWDYQWWYHRIINNGIDIISTKNLVKNIGFAADATHTANIREDIRNMTAVETDFPLVHPTAIAVDHQYDQDLSAEYYSVIPFVKPPLFKRVVNRIKQYI